MERCIQALMIMSLSTIITSNAFAFTTQSFVPAWCPLSSSSSSHQNFSLKKRNSFIMIPYNQPTTTSTTNNKKKSQWSDTIALRCASASEEDAVEEEEGEEEDPLGLTPELRLITDAFSTIPDEKLRYKQLLYMANQLAPITTNSDNDDDFYSPSNKVPGCLSTVHVDCSVTIQERKNGKQVPVMSYRGDSDGLLTKGLVALLVRGLSGHTAEEISRVNPEFINEAKITQSLTPGRNNGFLNMLSVMKRKAFEAEEQAVAAEEEGASTTENEQNTEDEEEKEEDIITTFEEQDGKPMYNAIMSQLIKTLKPVSIELVDNSNQHAGHAGSKGWEESGESHFALDITTNVFDGLALVKRHQLIYMLLGDIMPKIHALQIMAHTPEEAAEAAVKKQQKQQL